MKKAALPYWIIIAVVSALWLPWLLAKGMFMDGVYDALFAHNLAQGISTFWAPETIYYTNPAYWDNPPLSMFLLSVWYKVLGDHYRVERFYSLTCALVQMVLLLMLWKNYFRGREDVAKYSWLPVLLFLISPLTGWCYSNNMMENTMSIFTTATLLVFVMWWRRRGNIFLYASLSGLLIFLACITKGPVALFPLVAPLFFVWSEKDLKWQHALAWVALQLSVFAVVFALVFSGDAAQNFLRHYFDVQLLPALKHETKSADAQFTILIELLKMLSPFLVLSLLSIFTFRKSNSTNRQNFNAPAFTFLLIGLSASVPIALSAKQHHYYLLPSLPVFATGFAFLLLPLVMLAEQKLKPVWSEKANNLARLFCAGAVLLCIALCFINRNGFVRDEKLLTELEKIQPIVTGQQVIRADWQLYGEWSLRGYLNRIYGKKLCMPDEVAETNFYMTKPGLSGDGLPAESTKVFSGDMFDLYRLP